MSGFTLAEKVLARAAGRGAVRAGEAVVCRPDFVLAYVFGGFVRFPRLLSEQFGVERLARPGRFALFLDHNRPVVDSRLEARTDEARRWCEDQGAAVFDGEGIGHVVACEVGYAVPGALVLHFDGHVSQLGAYGALAIGVHIGIYEALARDEISLEVPPTVRVELTGALRPGVMARDLTHHLIAALGADFANGAVLEYHGPATEGLSPDELQTLANQAMFTGALTAVIEPTPRMLALGATRARIAPMPTFSDPDARFRGIFACDLALVEPMVAAPPSSANARPLAEVIGLPLDVGYLGSCASGRLDDLRVAARILSGRSIATGFRLDVVPSSRAILEAAHAEGTLDTLLAAGATVGQSGCNFCYGASGALVDRQRSVSSGTLNIPGRMGSAGAEVWLASPAVVAASALCARLADPRLLLS